MALDPLLLHGERELCWLRIIIPVLLTPAPTSDVPFTGGLELGVGAAMDLGSPALSANVFRFGSGSLTISIRQLNCPSNSSAEVMTDMFHPIYASRKWEGASSITASIAHCFATRRSLQDPFSAGKGSGFQEV